MAASSDDGTPGVEPTGVEATSGEVGVGGVAAGGTVAGGEAAGGAGSGGAGSGGEATESSAGGGGTPPSRPRRGAGPWLLALAGAVWSGVVYMKTRPSVEEGQEAADEISLAVRRGDAGGEGQEGAGRPKSASSAPEGVDRPVASPAPDAVPEEGEPRELGSLPKPWSNRAWAEGLNAPDVVTYTVRHGGMLKNVANLFKIFHHEITELNPGKRLEQALPPGSHVVVFKKRPDRSSRSIGTPSRGKLVGGVPMLEGPGRELKAIPWKMWGTAPTVRALDAALRTWATRYPDAHPVLVGNMSAREGGPLKPHSTHQSGRDVDLGYMQKWDRKEPLNWREMSKGNLDPARTWDLLALLAETGAVECIFIDHGLQKILYDYAVSAKKVAKADLSRWLEYPRPPGAPGALVQHVPGHVDHIHVRFACSRQDGADCKSNPL